MIEKEKREVAVAQKHHRMLLDLVKLIEREAPHALGYSAPGWALHRGRLTNRCTKEADIAFSTAMVSEANKQTAVADLERDAGGHRRDGDAVMTWRQFKRAVKRGGVTDADVVKGSVGSTTRMASTTSQCGSMGDGS